MAGQAKLKNIPVAFQELIDAGWTTEWDKSDRILEYSALEGKTYEGAFLNCLMAKQSGFKNLPGSVVLRKCRPGRVLCEAGQRGATVFYTLTNADAAAMGLPPVRPAEQAEVGSIYLPGKPQKKKTPGWGKRIRNLLKRQPVLAPEASPRFIPNDASVYLDAKTRSAPLLEGELTGEMTCLNRSPRSATIRIDTKCYVIEVTRSVFEGIYKHDDFIKWGEELYRQRILENHLRNDIPVFRSLSDDSYKKLQAEAEFVYFQPGEVIYDEHETPSDSFFVIRQGVVQVVRGTHLLLGPKEFSRTRAQKASKQILHAIGNNLDGIIVEFRELLSAEQLSQIEACANGDDRFETAESVRLALNHFLSHSDFAWKAAWKYRSLRDSKWKPDHKKQKKADALKAIGVVESQFHRFETGSTSQLDDNVVQWSDFERRLFNRMFLESICSDSVPARLVSEGEARVMRYMSRGEFFGEIGVLKKTPRSATVIAFDHPELGQTKREESNAIHRVELVRFSSKLLRSLANTDLAFRKQLEATIKERFEEDKVVDAIDVGSVASQAGANPQIKSLGLMQGQRQMLIDLDKCTRCNECVEACVESHDDGRARLFLDGPRFEKWLVPTSCRSCLDPVCMVGCPVGSILRGSDGEILIQDWCIGCKACADNCPYDSIQMHILDEQRELTQTEMEIGGGAELKRIDLLAVVCDNCSNNPYRPGEPACVYGCPHDAAIRVDSREFFFGEGQ